MTVVIPTWNGARHLPALIAALRSQSLAPEAILVIDSSSSDGSADLAARLGCQVEVIPQAEFNHGGTRNRGVHATSSAILVFLTQDALPADPQFLARLVEPIRSGTAAACFARQIPYDHASPPERMARGRNYPEAGQLRSAADIPRLGVRAYFFSNVASAVSRPDFLAVGGFPDDVIMYEDMVLCSRLLHAGRSVAYCADAVVRHSHDYSLGQQFRRYFDIGVFFASHGHLLPGAATSGEGLRFACHQVAWLMRRGHVLWALRSPLESACKFIGFRLGRLHLRLPAWLVRRCSMHAFHFAQHHAKTS
jgi:rhamnosyltransferase